MIGQLAVKPLQDKRIDKRLSIKDLIKDLIGQLALKPLQDKRIEKGLKIKDFIKDKRFDWPASSKASPR